MGGIRYDPPEVVGEDNADHDGVQNTHVNLEENIVGQKQMNPDDSGYLGHGVMEEIGVKEFVRGDTSKEPVANTEP